MWRSGAVPWSLFALFVVALLVFNMFTVFLPKIQRGRIVDYTAGAEYLKKRWQARQTEGGASRPVNSTNSKQEPWKPSSPCANQADAFNDRPSRLYSLGPPQRTLLTIVNKRHMAKSFGLHLNHILPETVRWTFVRINEVEELKRIETDVLLVIDGRFIQRNKQILQWATDWAHEHRKKTGHSVGLLHDGDEKNDANTEAYAAFDYVLRRFYFEPLKNSPKALHLRALGNLTCGTGPPWPGVESTAVPRLGVHYLPLMAATDNLFYTRPVATAKNHWPASAKRHNCSFIGGVKNKPDRADMLAALKHSQLGCDVSQVAIGAEDGHGPMEYLFLQAESSTFGLCPFGASPETYRHWEMLEHGLIVVSRRDAFLNAPFAPWPGLRGDSWRELVERMEELTAQPAELDRLQDESTAWMVRYLECMRADLRMILGKALAENSS